tara:strand:+ start:1332 stop:1646 length:315 start_codon:yes stop_codon:yes gene_type:complete
MEFRSRESEGEYLGEINQYRKLVRAILVEALRDMGRFGTEKDRASARRFIDTVMFDSQCEFLGWDSEWVRTVFERVHDLPPCVSATIARQCVHMLKGIPFGDVN